MNDIELGKLHYIGSNQAKELNLQFHLRFASPSRNCEMTEQSLSTYQSVTTWQAEANWEVEVRVGGFALPQAAANFGNSLGLKLKHEPNADYLTLIEASGKCHRIDCEQVAVRYLKQDRQNQLFINDDDFTILRTVFGAWQ